MIEFYLGMYLKYLAAVGTGYTIYKLTDNDIKRTKRLFKKIIKDKGVINQNTNQKATVGHIWSEKWGCKCQIDIANVVSFDEFEKLQDYIKQVFRAKEVTIENKEGKAIIEIINNPVDNIFYIPIELPPTQLLLGYNMKGVPIIVDMLKTPHCGVQGASNSGKSKCIELALNNLHGADIVLLNVFENDFKTVEGKRINGNENILNFLTDLIENPRNRRRPLYIALDELNVLGKDKQINKAIQDVLAQARHFNIYLIALGQSLLKENCPYKQLFNVRVTFRAIDRSTIGAFLGCTVEDTKLLQQEFICYANDLSRGKTYNYKF